MGSTVEPPHPNKNPTPFEEPRESDTKTAEELLRASQRQSPSGCRGRGKCGIGCLGLTIVVFVSMSWLVGWLFGESPIPTAESLIGPETSAFLIIRLDEQDPGVRALLQQSLNTMQNAMIDAPIPVEIKDILRKVGPANLHNILPVQVVVAYDLFTSDPHEGVVEEASPSTQARPTSIPTFVVSFGHFRGFSEVVFNGLASTRRGTPTPMKHRNHDILDLAIGSPSGQMGFVAHVKNNYVYAYHLEETRRAIDRLLSDSGSFGGSPRMAQMFGRLDVHQDMLAVASGDVDQIRRLLGAIVRCQDSADTPRFSPQTIDTAAVEINQIGCDIDILSQDEVSLHVIIDCQNAGAADRLHTFLEEVERETRRFTAAQSSTVRTVGTEVELRVRLGNLQKIIQESFDGSHLRVLQHASIRQLRHFP